MLRSADTVAKPGRTKKTWGKLVTSFTRADLKPKWEKPRDLTSVKNVQYVASYNWVDSPAPTIMVPGKPPSWTPLKKPRRLEPDSGTYYRDPNAAKFPKYPTEPAVQALLSTNPGYPTENIDVFGCSNTLGKFFQFARRLRVSFRFNVEVIGNTVFLYAIDPRALIDPRATIDVRGYGQAFLEAYRTWGSDVKGSVSNWRLVQYEFGGLRCVVRFGCDGYLQRDHIDMRGPRAEVEDHLNPLEATAIQKGMSDLDTRLAIQIAGSAPSQHDIFDVKTRFGGNNKDINMDMTEIYPSLWLKQIPNFIAAYHDGKGTFADVRVQNVQSDVQKWAHDNKPHIKRFAILLNKIVELARQDETGLLHVCSLNDHRLQIRRQYGKGTHALPLSLSAKWAGESHREHRLFERDKNADVQVPSQGKDASAGQ